MALFTLIYISKKLNDKGHFKISSNYVNCLVIYKLYVSEKDYHIKISHL